MSSWRWLCRVGLHAWRPLSWTRSQEQCARCGTARAVSDDRRRRSRLVAEMQDAIAHGDKAKAEALDHRINLIDRLP